MPDLKFHIKLHWLQKNDFTQWNPNHRKRYACLNNIHVVNSFIQFSGLFIIFGTAPWQICLARLFCGFAFGGAMILIPQFVAEIASDLLVGVRTYL